MNTIGVVIVTFNRIEKLKHTLKCYDVQKIRPKYVIVVNNASIDGTTEYLSDWKLDESFFKKIVINCDENIGGSGGFYKGLELAESLDIADWVWVSDDDAYPRDDAFEQLDNIINNHLKENVSVVCGIVIEHGKLAKAHRKNIIQEGFMIIEKPLDDECYKTEFEINTCTYVGSAISRKKLKEVGLPRKDYFIWYDDAEYTMRLSKVGKIICNPKIVINHDNQVQKNNQGISWMQYYGIRNSYDFYMKNFNHSIVKITFVLKIIKAFLSSLKHRNFSLYRMYLIAIYDAKNNNFGKSNRYYPGMK